MMRLVKSVLMVKLGRFVLKRKKAMQVNVLPGRTIELLRGAASPLRGASPRIRSHTTRQ